jgi:cytochrome c oxidase subunit 1
MYAHAQAVQGTNVFMSCSAWILGLAQLIFIVNFFVSLKKGQKASDNPWEATTLEWATPTPPPHGNFVTEPVVYRGPYEYSVPGQPTDFVPQHRG